MTDPLTTFAATVTGKRRERKMFGDLRWGVEQLSSAVGPREKPLALTRAVVREVTLGGMIPVPVDRGVLCVTNRRVLYLSVSSQYAVPLDAIDGVRQDGQGSHVVIRLSLRERTDARFQLLDESQAPGSSASFIATLNSAIAEVHSSGYGQMGTLEVDGPGSAPTLTSDELAKLAELRDREVLTIEEFEERKCALLGYQPNRTAVSFDPSRRPNR